MKKLSTSLKVMIVAVISSFMVLLSVSDSSARIYWKVGFKFSQGAANCDSIKGFCIYIQFGFEPFAVAQLADNYGYADVDINSLNQVHVVFDDSITDGNTTTITGNYYIGEAASHALGYDSVTILAGTYPVVFTTHTQFGEANFDAILTGPRQNLPVVGDCFPTLGRRYHKWHSEYGYGGTHIANMILDNFSTCTSPPLIGTATNSFTCTASGEISINGGPLTAFVSPATVSMNITADGTSGTTRHFTTEMLQLDIAGGTLPVGVMIRESPTKVSAGQKNTTDLGGGQYLINSFFDVYSELSTDGGQSWVPNNDPGVHMEMEDNSTAAIPTLSQWGLIALGILMLLFGIYFVRRVV